MAEQKTVFISYRRSTSQHLARSIYQDLKMNGWDVFFDVNTIDSGDFDRIILNQIGARAHFVLLISPDSLQRCVNPGDWVLREIEEAVRLNRNIVPIIEEGADFTVEMGYLQEPLRTIISKKNAPRLFHDYFEAGMEKLRTRFLKRPDYITINTPPAREQAEVQRRINEIDEILPSTPYTAQLIVDPRQSGAYSSINTALKAAPPGAHITVRPGIYQERLVLIKPITIEGEGGRDRVIVQTEDASCLVMRTDEATVSGLRLRSFVGAKNKQAFAVEIPQGQLILRNCEVISNSLSCIGIRNASARPKIIGCLIRDGNQSGVFVYDNGTGLIKDREILANAHAGISIRSGGNPIIQNCTIWKNNNHAIHVFKNGLGTVKDCDLRGNGQGAWDIDDSSSVQRSGNLE